MREWLRDWSFSESAEIVVGVLLFAAIVAVIFI